MRITFFSRHPSLPHTVKLSDPRSLMGKLARPDRFQTRFSAKNQIMWQLRRSFDSVALVQCKQLIVSYLRIFLAISGASLVCRFEGH